MIGVASPVGGHIDRQTVDIFHIAIWKIRLQRCQLTLRKKHILKFTKAAEGFPLLIFTLVFLFPITTPYALFPREMQESGTELAKMFETGINQ